MTKLVRSVLGIAAAFAIWSVLWAQQPQQKSETADERLARAEERLRSIEKMLEAGAESPTRLPDAALESRLSRIETRLDRLEANSLSNPVGASPDRMLESRVRMLERQVARLAR